MSGDLEKTDDLDRYKEKYGQLGTIVVRLWREQTLGRGDLEAYKARDTESIPEKALKGRPLDVATRSVSSRSQHARHTTDLKTEWSALGRTSTVTRPPTLGHWTTSP